MKKKGGRLSKKARAAEEKRLKAQRAAAREFNKRSKAAKKGWLTRMANEAAKSRKAKPPIFEEPFFEDDFATQELYDEQADYVDVIGFDSVYE